MLLLLGFYIFALFVCALRFGVGHDFELSARNQLGWYVLLWPVYHDVDAIHKQNELWICNTQLCSYGHVPWKRFCHLRYKTISYPWNITLYIHALCLFAVNRIFVRLNISICMISISVLSVKHDRLLLLT